MPINSLIPLSVSDPISAVSAIERINRSKELSSQQDRELSIREDINRRANAEEQRSINDEQFRDMAIDAAVLYDALIKGDEAGARRQIADRTRKIVARGGDPRDTQLVGALMNQGRYGEVQSLLEEIIGQGQLRGILPTADAQGGFTLAPGAARYDAQGNLIVDNPTAAEGPDTRLPVDLISPGGSRRSFRPSDPRINGLLDQGWTRAPARTQEVPFQVDVPTTEPPAPAAGQSLFERAEEGTGPGSAIRSIFATVGAIGGLEPSARAREVVRSRQALELASSNMIRSLAINPRFPVGEIERIQREVQIQPRFFDAPDIMQERMREIDAGLRRRMEQADSDAANPGLPGDVREAQRSNAQAIRNFLSDLGVPSQNGDELTPEDRAELERLREEQNAR